MEPITVSSNTSIKPRTNDVKIDENVTFSSLLLSNELVKGLEKCGFSRPSPVQLKAIPLGRCGLDLIVQAKSGTGKTCVFSVIALDGLVVDGSAVQVLILAPTREIAVQIWEVINAIGSAVQNLYCFPFIGGLPLEEDKNKLKTCQIAVGTPGRVRQLIEEGLLNTGSIRLFVLDEADKLLEDGFQDVINWIYSTLPTNKQILALSATYPEILAKHLTSYMRNPTYIRLNSDDPALLGIRQYWRKVTFHPLPQKAFDYKVKELIEILSKVSFNQCLVFSNYQMRAQSLSDLLEAAGWPTTCISGSLDQQQRLTAIAQLKKYKCRVLISTDLTSRGIDAENVNLVINLDIPKDHETYLHRIGRAGRFGSYGAGISLAAEGEEYEQLYKIQQQCKTVIKELPDPIPSGLAHSSGYVNIDNLVTVEKIVTEAKNQNNIQQLKINDDEEATLDYHSNTPNTEDNGVDSLNNETTSNLEPAKGYISPSDENSDKTYSESKSGEVERVPNVAVRDKTMGTTESPSGGRSQRKILKSRKKPSKLWNDYLSTSETAISDAALLRESHREAVSYDDVNIFSSSGKKSKKKNKKIRAKPDELDKDMSQEAFESELSHSFSEETSNAVSKEILEISSESKMKVNGTRMDNDIDLNRNGGGDCNITSNSKPKQMWSQKYKEQKNVKEMTYDELLQSYATLKEKQKKKAESECSPNSENSPVKENLDKVGNGKTAHKDLNEQIENINEKLKRLLNSQANSFESSDFEDYLLSFSSLQNEHDRFMTEEKSKINRVEDLIMEFQKKNIDLKSVEKLEIKDSYYKEMLQEIGNLFELLDLKQDATINRKQEKLVNSTDNESHKINLTAKTEVSSNTQPVKPSFKMAMKSLSLSERKPIDDTEYVNKSVLNTHNGITAEVDNICTTVNDSKQDTGILPPSLACNNTNKVLMSKDTAMLKLANEGLQPPKDLSLGLEYMKKIAAIPNESRSIDNEHLHLLSEMKSSEVCVRNGNEKSKKICAPCRMEDKEEGELSDSREDWENSSIEDGEICDDADEYCNFEDFVTNTETSKHKPRDLPAYGDWEPVEADDNHYDAMNQYYDYSHVQDIDEQYLPSEKKDFTPEENYYEDNGDFCETNGYDYYRECHDYNNPYNQRKSSEHTKSFQQGNERQRKSHQSYPYMEDDYKTVQNNETYYKLMQCSQQYSVAQQSMWAAYMNHVYWLQLGQDSSYWHYLADYHKQCAKYYKWLSKRSRNSRK